MTPIFLNPPRPPPYSSVCDYKSVSRLHLTIGLADLSDHVFVVFADDVRNVRAALRNTRAALRRTTRAALRASTLASTRAALRATALRRDSTANVLRRPAVRSLLPVVVLVRVHLHGYVCNAP